MNCLQDCQQVYFRDLSVYSVFHVGNDAVQYVGQSRVIITVCL